MNALNLKAQQKRKFRTQPGFIAALDQSEALLKARSGLALLAAMP